jgi:hypothetical protein
MLYASDAPLTIKPQAGKEQAQVDHILEDPTIELNTLANRTLERHVDIELIFDLPKNSKPIVSN